MCVCVCVCVCEQHPPPPPPRLRHHNYDVHCEVFSICYKRCCRASFSIPTIHACHRKMNVSGCLYLSVCGTPLERNCITPVKQTLQQEKGLIANSVPKINTSDPAATSLSMLVNAPTIENQWTLNNKNLDQVTVLCMPSV